MTQEQHPITPPPELVEQWYQDGTEDVVEYVATQAARWGADMELEACCEWIYKLMDRGLEWSMDLRAARRHKPPSLKEQALEALDSATYQPGTDFKQIDPTRSAILRRALEALPDD